MINGPTVNDSTGSFVLKCQNSSFQGAPVLMVLSSNRKIRLRTQFVLALFPRSVPQKSR